MPRVRRSFNTKSEALDFEADYIERHTVDANYDGRRLATLIDEWYRAHGFSLEDGKRRQTALLAMAQALDNPVASLLDPVTYTNYRFERRKVISAKTCNNELGYLNAVFNKLRQLKVIGYECPTCSIDALKMQEPQLIYLTRSEINVLFDEIRAKTKNSSLVWVYELCLRTGARWGEAEKIKRSQLHNCSITFVRTKSGKTRTVPLDKAFFQQLLSFSRGANQRVFSNCISAFRRAVERSDIVLPAGQMTHICRHTFASYFMMNGGNILTLKHILGHSDIKMTMRYAHLAPDHLKDAVKFGPLS